MNLYWVTTKDHVEDWFVVASNHMEAETFFADFEGYGFEDAIAEFIMAIPAEIGVGPEARHPYDTLLKQLGGEYVRSSPITVKLNGRIFQEGTLQLWSWNNTSEK